ncbi:hypothetical protein A9Q89_01475 [Gammaproteobacteria bacterium 53_120_T64]|nr:hypothetical protein A9Q89_01475 [Gammaproteobacteria bacterium 53_120_T64]
MRVYSTLQKMAMAARSVNPGGGNFGAGLAGINIVSGDADFIPAEYKARLITGDRGGSVSRLGFVSAAGCPTAVSRCHLSAGSRYRAGAFTYHG